MIKNTLIFNNKIEIRRSPIHGWGIFAKDDIKSGEILEESLFLILPIAKGESSYLLLDYRFNYPRMNSEHQVVVFGFSSFYNHSNTPNAKWETDEENQLFIFEAIKDINKDEEILVYYGGVDYWTDGRTHTNVV